VLPRFGDSGLAREMISDLAQSRDVFNVFLSSVKRHHENRPMTKDSFSSNRRGRRISRRGIAL